MFIASTILANLPSTIGLVPARRSRAPTCRRWRGGLVSCVGPAGAVFVALSGVQQRRGGAGRQDPHQLRRAQPPEPGILQVRRLEGAGVGEHPWTDFLVFPVLVRLRVLYGLCLGGSVKRRGSEPGGRQATLRLPHAMLLVRKVHLSFISIKRFAFPSVYRSHFVGLQV